MLLFLGFEIGGGSAAEERGTVSSADESEAVMGGGRPRYVLCLGQQVLSVAIKFICSSRVIVSSYQAIIWSSRVLSCFT